MDTAGDPTVRVKMQAQLVIRDDRALISTANECHEPIGDATDEHTLINTCFSSPGAVSNE